MAVERRGGDERWPVHVGLVKESEEEEFSCSSSCRWPTRDGRTVRTSGGGGDGEVMFLFMFVQGLIVKGFRRLP